MPAHDVSQEKRDKRGRWVAGGAIGGATVAGMATMAPRLIRKAKKTVKHTVKTVKENREQTHFDKSFKNINEHYNQSVINKAKGIKSFKIDLTDKSRLSKLKKKIKATATNAFIAKESFKKGVQTGKKVQKVVEKIPTKEKAIKVSKKAAYSAGAVGLNVHPNTFEALETEALGRKAQIEKLPAKIKKLTNNIKYYIQHYKTDKYAVEATKRPFKFGVKIGRKIEKLGRFRLLKKVLNLSFDPSKHPRGQPKNKGWFAPKNKKDSVSNAPKNKKGNVSNTPKQRDKAGRIRFTPKKGEKSIHEAYSRKIKERKLERFKKKLDKKALTPEQKERRINKYLRDAKKLNEEAKESNSLGSTAKTTAASIAMERAYYKYAPSKKPGKFFINKKFKGIPGGKYKGKGAIKRVALLKRLKRAKIKTPIRFATKKMLFKRQLRVGRVAIKKTPVLGKVVRAMSKLGKFGVKLAIRSAPYLTGAAIAIGQAIGNLSTGGLLAVATMAAACAYGAYRYYRYRSDKKKHEKVKAIIAKYGQRKNQPSFA